MSACPIYTGQQVDAGPDCCDLECMFTLEREPLLWEGSD